MSKRIDRAAFFQGAREIVRKYRGTGLTQEQVDGLNTKLDVWEEWYEPRGYDWRYLVSVLGQGAIETGWTWQPVFERGSKAYFKKYDPAFNPKKAAELGNTEAGDGWRFRGAGDIQNTGRRNARVSARRLNEVFGTNYDFEADPESRAEPFASAHCAFLGCIEGWWTGKKLADYITPMKTDYRNARRVVNGTDKASLINRICIDFHRLIRDTRVTAADAPPLTAPRPVPLPSPVRPPVKKSTKGKSSDLTQDVMAGSGLLAGVLGLIYATVQKISIPGDIVGLIVAVVLFLIVAIIVTRRTLK